MIQINSDEELWEHIEAYRQANALRKKVLADRLGISRMQYDRYCKARKICGDRVEFINTFSKVLGQPIQIGGDPDAD